MDFLFRIALKTFIRRGTLRLTTAAGMTITCGDGTGNPVAVRFTSAAAQRAVLLDPELALGEAYMDGTFVIDEGTIADFLSIAVSQDPTGKPPYWARVQWTLRYLRRRWQQFNPPWRARRNVAHHYDLDGRLYSLFLDADRQYSCAYFETTGAIARRRPARQEASPRREAAVPKPGLRVLDIGCGWGGLGLYLADHCGANVTGVTLSEEQLRLAHERAAEQGLTETANFHLQDYRELGGTFDRIVSVGMFEHVGVSFYDTFFDKCTHLLADDGVMMLHSIGRSEGPNVTNPWIAKYIFPGGYIPSLSEVLPAIERSGLLITDIEILRLHYAETLKSWRQRFVAHRDDAERIYDQRFVRMWEFYLAASETAFREGAMMVFQIQLARRQNVVPMTRDYIAREEERLRALEASKRPQLRIAGE